MRRRVPWNTRLSRWTRSPSSPRTWTSRRNSWRPGNDRFRYGPRRGPRPNPAVTANGVDVHIPGPRDRSPDGKRLHPDDNPPFASASYSINRAGSNLLIRGIGGTTVNGPGPPYTTALGNVREIDLNSTGVAGNSYTRAG